MTAHTYIMAAHTYIHAACRTHMHAHTVTVKVQLALLRWFPNFLSRHSTTHKLTNTRGQWFFIRTRFWSGFLVRPGTFHTVVFCLCKYKQKNNYTIPWSGVGTSQMVTSTPNIFNMPTTEEVATKWDVERGWQREEKWNHDVWVGRSLHCTYQKRTFFFAPHHLSWTHKLFSHL